MRVQLRSVFAIILLIYNVPFAQARKVVKLIVPQKIKYIHHTHVLFVRSKPKLREELLEDVPYRRDVPYSRGKPRVKYVPYYAESQHVSYRIPPTEYGGDDFGTDGYYRGSPQEQLLPTKNRNRLRSNEYVDQTYSSWTETDSSYRPNFKIPEDPHFSSASGSNFKTSPFEEPNFPSGTFRPKYKNSLFDEPSFTSVARPNFKTKESNFPTNFKLPDESNFPSRPNLKTTISEETSFTSAPRPSANEAFKLDNDEPNFTSAPHSNFKTSGPEEDSFGPTESYRTITSYDYEELKNPAPDEWASSFAPNPQKPQKMYSIIGDVVHKQPSKNEGFNFGPQYSVPHKNSVNNFNSNNFNNYRPTEDSRSHYYGKSSYGEIVPPKSYAYSQRLIPTAAKWEYDDKK